MQGTKTFVGYVSSTREQRGQTIKKLFQYWINYKAAFSTLLQFCPQQYKTQMNPPAFLFRGLHRVSSNWTVWASGRSRGRMIGHWVTQRKGNIAHIRHEEKCNKIKDQIMH